MFDNVKNEQGVIVLFSQKADGAGFDIVNVHTEFPDAIIRKGGVEYRAEFEYQSSNFRAHKHDIRKCDVIICWVKDSESILPILALSEKGWENMNIALPSDSDREIEYWKQRALAAEESSKRLANNSVIHKPASKAQFLSEWSKNGHESAAEFARKLGVNERTAQLWVKENS